MCLSATVLTLDQPIVVKLRFVRGYPSLMSSFEGNLPTQRHQIISLETRGSNVSYSEDPVSLSDLCLIRYRVVTPRTDGQTDRIAIANTRSQQYQPVQLSRVKMCVYVGYEVRRFSNIFVTEHCFVDCVSKQWVYQKVTQKKERRYSSSDVLTVTRRKQAANKITAPVYTASSAAKQALHLAITATRMLTRTEVSYAGHWGGV